MRVAPILWATGECTLRLSLDSQSEDEVSGSFAVGDQCSGGAADEVTGTLCEVPDRTIRCTEDRIYLTLSLTSGGDDALVALTDCEHSDGNSALTGAVRGGNIALASNF